LLLETERRIADAGLAQVSSGLLPEGTVLLSSRAPIGYLAIAEVPVAINQGFIAVLRGDRTRRKLPLAARQAKWVGNSLC
jgi:type I restriction enzyme, S subunit